MKTYPSIPKDIRKDLDLWAFDKLDGSNIRAEWTRKNGFSKFGSRRVLIDESTPILGESIELIKQYEKSTSELMKKHRIDKAVLFFEFYGENSFAGNHAEEEHKVTLIDVDVYKKGIVSPGDFVDIFSETFDIPSVLHRGRINNELIESVRSGTLEGMTFEGVVCKAKNPKKTLRPVMFKIKNQAWLDKLKSFCGEDAELFRRIS